MDSDNFAPLNCRYNEIISDLQHKIMVIILAIGY